MTERVVDIRNMDTLLTSLLESTSGETVSVEDLLNAVGRRAFGPLLLLLGFVAVSPLTIIPGTSWLTALVTLLIAGQVVLGNERPWLPKRALQARFPRATLTGGIAKMRGLAHIVDKLVCPRFGILTAPPFLQMTALLCVIAALITFPLGLVPFGPVLPGLTIMFFGLGLTARDGVMLMIAGGAMVGSALIMLRVMERLF